METLLNLVWLLVCSGLVAWVFCSHRRAALRTSLAVALGCCGLIAILLFPAVSMTDDLQRQRLDVERQARTLADTFLLGVLDKATEVVVCLGILLLLLGVALRERAGVVLRWYPNRLRRVGVCGRPQAVRPPPYAHRAVLLCQPA